MTRHSFLSYDGPRLSHFIAFHLTFLVCICVYVLCVHKVHTCTWCEWCVMHMGFIVHSGVCSVCIRYPHYSHALVSTQRDLPKNEGSHVTEGDY